MYDIHVRLLGLNWLSTATTTYLLAALGGVEEASRLGLEEAGSLLLPGLLNQSHSLEELHLVDTTVAVLVHHVPIGRESHHTYLGMRVHVAVLGKKRTLFCRVF